MNILDDMLSKGHEPNVVTYSTIVDGLWKKGKIDKAINM
jgi:PPR repeat